MSRKGKRRLIMDLWIRSQDKTSLRKIDSVYLIEDLGDRPGDILNAKYNFTINANYAECLGRYKTKKRALEVLDEIQNILKPRMMAYISPSEEMVELMGGRSFGKTQTIKQDMEIKELSTYVYEMPQK